MVKFPGKFTLSRGVTLAYDKPLKAIFLELLENYFDFSKVDTEYGVLLKEVRIDILIENLKPKKDFPKNSWIGFIVANRRRFIVIEAKSIGSKANLKAIRKLFLYKAILAEKFDCSYKEIMPVLIVSRVPSVLERRLKENIDRNLTIIGKEGLYKISGSEALEILVIAVDELNPKVEYNEILMIFSSIDELSKKAAIEILRRYPSSTFLYAFAIIYRPEVSQMAKTELIPPERLALAISVIGVDKLVEAIEVIGIDKLARALGPERTVKMIEEVGIDKLAKALGPERTVKIVLDLVKTLPKDLRRKLLGEILASFLE